MIPKMTHPLSSAWDQPNPEDVLIDKTHALMSENDFNDLLDYSHSQPSGVYVGKMWKSKVRDNWILCWFGPHTDPNMCSGNNREILIA